MLIPAAGYNSSPVAQFDLLVNHIFQLTIFTMSLDFQKPRQRGFLDNQNNIDIKMAQNQTDVYNKKRPYHQMKGPTQQKSKRIQISLLQPVNLQVETSQKAIPFNPILSSHINTAQCTDTALQYNQILSQAMQDLIIQMLENMEADLSCLHRLFEIKKQRISYVAVINLSIINKLTYIIDRCRTLNVKNILDKLQAQLCYWKEFICYALVDTTQEKEVYLGKKKQIIQGIQKVDEEVEEVGVREQISKSKNTKKEVAQNTKVRIMKNRSRPKNGVVNNTQGLYDYIDS